MNIIKKILFNLVIPALILVGGVVLFKKMKASKKPPQKIKIERKIPAVEIKHFKKSDENLIIKESGIIYFPDTVNLIPRVTGNIVKLSDKLFIGGFIKKGDVLAIIDQQDYRLNIETAEAEVLNRETALQKEKEEAKLAKVEWDIYKKANKNAKPSNLRLRIPQVNSAKAFLKSAKANLKRAKLNLSRTYIKAPFDAKVKNRNVSIGQFVSQGTVIASLQGTKRAYARVYLRDEDLGFVSDIFSNKLNVEITFNSAGKEVRRKGKIISYGAELDPKTKMLEAIVEIKDPYKDETPIISGTFVTVTIVGKKENDIVKLPEEVVVENKVYLYNNGHLEIKEITILKQYDRELLVKGIKESDSVIISPVVDVVNNMKVEKIGEKK